MGERLVNAEPLAVEVGNLSKVYSLSGSQLGRFRHLFASGKGGAGLRALSDVSFKVQRGEAFGIIGSNGSGKSTLLQIIAGILKPTSGSVMVNGRLSSLLELGSGFSPEFTGRENVYLNASILGLTRQEIDDRFETIQRFAEIGDFIDQPIRTYSTGMVLRLAFAVTAHVDPEVLIIDEALAVGDLAFRQRCMRRIHDLRARGVTILFVSHDATDVKALCERTLWLKNGVVEQLGETDATVERYLAATFHREIVHSREAGTTPNPGAAADFGAQSVNRHGDGRASIVGAELVFQSGAPVRMLAAHERAVLKVRIRVNEAVSSPIAGFLVRNSRGENLFGTNTARENYPVPVLSPGDTHEIVFHWTAPEISAGAYSISLAIADGDLEAFEICDFIDGAVNFTVAGESGDRGYFRLRCASVAVHLN